ncbi:hypothetical protein ACLQ18_39435 [Streptomyces sp. DT193]|uniref:hypothetical protein n=1 Tax=Streptomyces sp. DT193 TaxID=3393418 RepID=UPI003CEF3D82
MSEYLTLLGAGTDQEQPHPSPSWRFSVIPPKPVRQQIYGKIKNGHRPAGSLALTAITTTGTLYFTHVLPHSDTVMAFGLTTLVVAYDSVIAVCRTWLKTTMLREHSQGKSTPSSRAA